jgi:tetratricopeptide (TPR) repeat protein
MRGGGRRTRARLLWAVAACAIGCQAPPQIGAGSPSGTTRDPAQALADADARRHLTRRALEDARALRVEGRLDAAERVARRGLAEDPRHAALLRELAHVLDAQARPEAARAARAQADAIDPPPPPLPESGVATGPGGSLVVIVESTADLRLEEPGRFPPDDVQQALARRIEVRLPGAHLRLAAPESVDAAARWLSDAPAVRVLSLRVDRADCRFSVKDGAIAVAELRVAAAARGDRAADAVPVKSVVTDPPPAGCTDLAVARALEAALASPAWARVLAAGSAGAEWSNASLRALFPGISRRIERELRSGRALLGAGRLAEARDRFEAALRIDPSDPDARAHLDDAERSLALARELAARAPGADADGDAGALDPRLSAAQRAAAEVALEREQRRRDELLAALAVLDEDVRAPDAGMLRALPEVAIALPDAFGPSLARERAGGPVEARAAYAPDGQVIARYYFAPEADAPILREEDTDGDGDADRWIAYRDASRSEIYEDARGRGRPDRRLVFAAGGEPLERIEIDVAGDALPDRVFRYRGGRLVAEESDTDGDGEIDRFDRFGADGRVDLREEDLDGDGEIDVRSMFRGGKLVRRELSSDEDLPGS